MVKKKVSKRISRKKSYNPFKMIGSYIGAFLGLIFIPVLATILDGGDLVMFWNELTNVSSFVGLIFGLILGFFIGYRIHSLIRRKN